MRAGAYLRCAAVLSVALFGQSAENPPAFEVADVHLSPPTRNPFMRGPRNRGGRYELRTATMVDLVSAAYGINANEILGGPSWLEMDRFDVIAKLPVKSTPDMAKLMLQALLAERFKLVIPRTTSQCLRSR
jgi:uncharacterized protein (TIGR03435 family)